jgi:predicted HTH transcriptional regulator
MDLQELVTRGRFLFSGAPDRLQVFERVNGKRTAKEIASGLRRRETAVLKDLARLRDAGLIEPRRDPSSAANIKKGAAVLYDKLPLARTIPLRYFQEPTSRPRSHGSSSRRPRPARRPTGRRTQALAVPSEAELIDICQNGEDQLHEFKAAGTEIRKVVKEVAAMAVTSQGGLVLYGVADDGKVHGSDQTAQKFDQPLQNCVRSSIEPPLAVRLHSVAVLGSTVLVVIVPPWNRKDVYHFEDRVLIRKGTNAFPAKPGESRKLHAGIPVI